MPSMRSLCHLNNRYAIVPLVTYSLIYRNPNDLWKVLLSPFPTSAILCCDRSDLWKVPRTLRSQHKIADVGKGLTDLIATNINWVNLQRPRSDLSIIPRSLRSQH